MNKKIREVVEMDQIKEVFFKYDKMKVVEQTLPVGRDRPAQEQTPAEIKTPGEVQKKLNKTSAEAIKVSSDRYYANKSTILRAKAMKNIEETNSLPTLKTMEKHGITWEDVARQVCNPIRNAKNPSRQQKLLVEA